MSSRRSWRSAWACLGLACLSACDGGTAPIDASAAVDAGGDAGSDGGRPPCTAPAEPTRLVVTADWMSRSLTLLGLERTLDPGCSAEEARVGTIDLAAYAPGPIQIELAPDGRTALVAVGPGFFTGVGGGLVGNPDPELEGSLLVVDLVDRAVVTEIETAAIPFGMAIAPDGQRAYVVEYGYPGAPGSTLAIVDLATHTIVEHVEVGESPEQVALSEDGTIGALSVDGLDAVRVFRTSDVAGTLSAPLMTGSDPSDIAFVPGTSLFVVSNSMAASVSIVDVTDPAAPVVIASPRAFGVSYAVTSVPGTEDVVTTTSVREQLVRVSASNPSTPAQRIPLAGGPFLLSVAVTADGASALVPHPVSHALSIVDLRTASTHEIAWLDRPGPTYVAIQP